MGTIWAYREQLWWNLTSWILVGITLIGLCARLYVRVHVRGSLLSLVSWHWSDIFLVLAWIGFFIGSLIQLICFAHYGYVSSEWELTQGEPRYVIVRKLTWVWTITFWLWMFLVKASLLCFFDELVERWSHPKIWWSIRVVGVIVALGFVGIAVYGVVWCQPIYKQWAFGIEYCWAEFDAKFKMTMFRQLVHAATDIMVMLIPLPLLPMLSGVPLWKRIGVAIMFLLGLFCTISSIIYANGSVQQWDNPHYNPSPTATRFVEFEPVVELGAAILIQCVPGMRAFFGAYRRRKETVLEMPEGQNRVSRLVERGGIMGIGGGERRISYNGIIKKYQVGVDDDDAVLADVIMLAETSSKSVGESREGKIDDADTDALVGDAVRTQARERSDGVV